MQVYRRAGPRLIRHSPFFISQRNAGILRPVNWVREKLAPATKEEEKPEAIKAAKEQAKKAGTANVFEDLANVKALAPIDTDAKGKSKVKGPPKSRPQSHKYSTANFKISHRKLNMLGNQLAGKPIDQAILQMQFSEKRASTRIMNMLVTARDHAARYKRLEQGKLVVAEAWVTKGQRPPARIEPRGRGHYGRRTHPNSKLSVVLKEGKTLEQQKAAARKRKLDRIVSAALVREDKPIRNPSLAWAW